MNYNSNFVFLISKINLELAMIKQLVIRFASRPEVPKFFFSTAKAKKSTRPEYNIFQALKLARTFSVAPYDESVEICIQYIPAFLPILSRFP